MYNRMDILVCGGTGCQASNSVKVIESLNREIKDAGLDQEVRVITTGCFGFCEQGPIVKIQPDNIFYVRVTPESAVTLVREHVMKGRIVQELLYEEPQKKRSLKSKARCPSIRSRNV